MKLTKEQLIVIFCCKFRRNKLCCENSYLNLFFFYIFEIYHLLIFLYFISFKRGLLKSLLKKREDLKVIIMSATLNIDKFANYFETDNVKK
jgi:hypothetical protein